MKQIADRKRVDVEFQIGDMVFVKLQPYRQSTLRSHGHQKLGLRYFGLFLVVERVGPVAYRLLLPPSARIHPIFHVSLLKKFMGNSSQQYVPLSLNTAVEDSQPIPCRILDSRRIKQQGRWVDQVLVHWAHLPRSDNTWESVSFMQQHFPSFDLEVKVNLNGGGIDTGSKSTTKYDIEKGHAAYDDMDAITEFGKLRCITHEKRKTWKLQMNVEGNNSI
uniref:Uncharacterized protein n=1 Tax=Cajanus cajan TaxID=3821 RepID=A0A151SFZ2_CAJCA|nr:hypothetical protein KK1_024263 [Cajanus cajan]